MFTLQHKPELYQEIEKGLDSVDDVDYELLRNEVLKCFTVSEIAKHDSKLVYV